MICNNVKTINKQDNESDSDYDNRVYLIMDEFFNDLKETFKLNEKPLRFRENPKVNGQHQIYWHITTEGNQHFRVRNQSRLERSTWSHHILKNCFAGKYGCNYSWIRNQKQKRYHIWCVDLQYIVVLEERNDYILFITAYPTDRSHTQRKLLKEYQRSEKLVFQ